MRNEISKALEAAVDVGDKRRISTLRLILAAIKDRDLTARSNDRRCVDEVEVRQILAKMVDQRHLSMKAYEEQGRPELAQQEQEEIDIIESFLPRQLSEEETRSAVNEIMDEVGCEKLKDLGRAIGTLKERYPGQMDFSKAREMVRERIERR